MKYLKSILHGFLAAVFSIFDRNKSHPSADFGTADRAEERERDRRFIAEL